MVLAIVLSTVLLADPWLPAKVQPAENFPAQLEGRSTPGIPPTFRLAKIPGRKEKSIKEWRDQRQNYAIIWTARPVGYRALRIRDGAYKPLPGDLAPNEKSAKVHAKFEDAQKAVNAHWRFLRGK